jgi:hypothetical protein
MRTKIRTEVPNQREEAAEIARQYGNAIKKIPEVMGAEHQFAGEREIDFVVVVAERVHRELSHQLAGIESKFYDEYPDWSFDFEHLGYRAYMEQNPKKHFILS